MNEQIAITSEQQVSQPHTKITIFGKDHDPSKEIEIYAPKDKEDKEDIWPKNYTQIVDTPYGLSAIVIFKANPLWTNQTENSYDLMHNCREIHYLHHKGMCAFEGWGTGRNLMFSSESFENGDSLKEMHIIKSPKWFGTQPYDQENQVVYQYPSHPPLDKKVHPSWTGYLPPYAAQPINA
jgi:hypothetical protein